MPQQGERQRYGEAGARKQREALRPTEQEGVFTLLVEEWKTTKELKERKRITMPHKPQEKEDYRVFFE